MAVGQRFKLTRFIEGWEGLGQGEGSRHKQGAKQMGPMRVGEGKRVEER